LIGVSQKKYYAAVFADYVQNKKLLRLQTETAGRIPRIPGPAEAAVQFAENSQKPEQNLPPQMSGNQAQQSAQLSLEKKPGKKATVSKY
jgi:hypothetical protein